MLGNSPALTNIPVVDVARAKTFYVDVLGLKLLNEAIPGIMLLEAGEGTKVLLYQRAPSKADHTVMSFTVDDIYAAANELRAKGVNFEHYELGNGVVTDTSGVATMGPAKAAWFKDTEGNILGLNQRM